MNVGRLQNHMRLQAMLAASARTHTRIGIVTSLDSKNYCVKAELQPGGQETGWLPIMSALAGNGWGMFAPIPVGSQVKIEFLEGSVDVGMVSGALFSTEDAPLDVPSGEFWLVHVSGTALKLTNDGKLLLNSATEIDAGNLQNALFTLLTHAFKATYNAHTHTSAAPGSPTSAPITPLDDSPFTTVLKAN